MICVNRLTNQEREVPYGKEHLNFDGDVCQDPFEYKKVLGQGNPMYENSESGVQSRFLDPNDPANNAWIPDSVPGVQAQSCMKPMLAMSLSSTSCVLTFPIQRIHPEEAVFVTFVEN